MADIPCPACGAPSCPFTRTTRKRSVSRCRALPRRVEGEGGG